MTDLFQDKAQDWDVNDRVKTLSLGIGSAILENVELDNSMQVMDFGAGTGLITAQVAPKVDKVTAVDVSVAMLEKLAAKESLKGKVDIVCQNILEQPIEKKFDLIVSAMAMHHVEDTNKMIACFAALLNPGASVALADLDQEDGTFHPQDIQGVYHSGFDRESFRSLLEANGFKDIRFVTAHTVNKEEKSYPVFLALAKKA